MSSTNGEDAMKGLADDATYERLQKDVDAVKDDISKLAEQLSDALDAFTSAARFCTAFDELRQYFRSRATSQKTLSLPDQRRLFRQRFTDLFVGCQAA